MALIYSLHSEILKLLYRRATHVVLFLILVFQTFLANIGASQIVSVGIHATPETNPDLAEAIPPIEFLGFDVTLFGVFYYDYPRLNLRSRGVQRLCDSYKPPLYYKSKYFPSFKNISLAYIFFHHFLSINIPYD